MSSFQTAQQASALVGINQLATENQHQALPFAL